MEPGLVRAAGRAAGTASAASSTRPASASAAPAGEIEITIGLTVRYPGRVGDEEGEALAGTPAEVAAGLAAHDAVGVDHAIAYLEPTTPETLAAFVEAVRIYRGG